LKVRKESFLKKIAEHPERFIGLFRPSKPGTKILQHLLQSYANGERLSLDQFFTDGRTYYFIEQKIRDDHDSSKKRGQVANFKAKLEEIFRQYKKVISQE